MQKNYRPSGIGIIPAEPGTYFINAYFDDNQIDLVRANVIGWKIGNDSRVSPLLIDQRAADVEPWYVQHPDGRVECSNGRVWDSLDAWTDEERRAKREAA